MAEQHLARVTGLDEALHRGRGRVRVGDTPSFGKVMSMPTMSNFEPDAALGHGPLVVRVVGGRVHVAQHDLLGAHAHLVEHEVEHLVRAALPPGEVHLERDVRVLALGEGRRAQRRGLARGERRRDADRR